MFLLFQLTHVREGLQVVVQSILTLLGKVIFFLSFLLFFFFLIYANLK